MISISMVGPKRLTTLQFTGANRHAVRQGSRREVKQRLASGATASYATPRQLPGTPRALRIRVHVFEVSCLLSGAFFVSSNALAAFEAPKALSHLRLGDSKRL
jgi:hypothetical protein